MAKNVELKATDISVYASAAAPVRVSVDFVLNHNPHDTDYIAKALDTIYRQLAEGVNFVKSADKPRCYYCGSLNDEDAKKCEGCGATC